MDLYIPNISSKCLMTLGEITPPQVLLKRVDILTLKVLREKCYGSEFSKSDHAKNIYKNMNTEVDLNFFHEYQNPDMVEYYNDLYKLETFNIEEDKSDKQEYPKE